MDRHQSRDSSQARRPWGLLNPIMEESSDDGQDQRGRRANPSHLKIEAWLSPSDQLPNSRGGHYFAAPVLPASPSVDSFAETSPTASFAPWSRTSLATATTDFGDLYDVSDEEGTTSKKPQRRPSVKSRPTSIRQPARLVIPAKRNGNTDETWSATEELKKMISPTTLTPSVKLTMSPAQLDFMDMQQALAVPTISAPPSLDGSLTSEQLALMSAPPTPVVDNDDATTEDVWAGVQLQPGALATLHALSNSDDESYEQPAQALEVPPESTPSAPEMEQQSMRLMTDFQRQPPQGPAFTPGPRRQTLIDLTTLDIPSPGGFFSGLSPLSRNTWRVPPIEDVVPPTSTTAEQFYKCPWNADPSIPPVPKRKDTPEDFYRSFTVASEEQRIVEHVVEVRDEDDMSDDVPTARPLPSAKTPTQSQALTSPAVEDTPTEIVVDYDPDYARKQQEEALLNLDRTGMWLMAQHAYLRGVGSGSKEEDNEERVLDAIAEEPEDDKSKDPESAPDLAVVPARKTVRFSDLISVSAHPKSLPSKLGQRESAYYRAFQDYIIRTQRQDVFVHQLARFEALQAQRVSLRSAHRNQLLGKFQLSVVPQSAKKRLSANVARGDDDLVDDPEKLRREKEVEAMKQMTLSTWHVAAIKMLNGGRLILAPVTKRLTRLSFATPNPNSSMRDRVRILDLGGQATCDWAWHCAFQFPNAKVYTVTTKTIRQLSNSNIRGPSNHRQVAVERLTRLPFPDNHFDLISARELHSTLKFVGENGEDEWETCLKECMRVLKPGGYLEFSLLDSDIINPGPIGGAKSVEFGFTLKTLGYDPNPTRLWLGRLARAGFQDIRRMWMCLPMGPKHNPYKSSNLRVNPNGEEARTCQLDAMVMGSSDDIAGVCSIVGGWSWERWLLRCATEKVAGELRLADMVTAAAEMKEAGKCLDGVPAVFEEGRNMRSGFRMLNGYARKPSPDSKMAGADWSRYFS